MVVRHVFIALLLAAPGVATILSCAPPRREPLSSTRPSLECRSWNGKHREELMRVWGRPTGSRSDGKGGFTLEYRSLEVSMPGDPNLAIPRPRVVEDVSPPNSVASALPPTYVSEAVEAAFRIDAQGAVYDYWISPDRWEKGFPMPCGGWYPGRKPRSFPSN